MIAFSFSLRIVPLDGGASFTDAEWCSREQRTDARIRRVKWDSGPSTAPVEESRVVDRFIITT